MDRPFKIIDGDGHVTETEDQVRRYMPEAYRSSGSHLRAGHGYWDINLGGKLGGQAKDAATWLDAMDRGDMETAVLFPTSVGLTASLIWEPEVAVEVARAYNKLLYEEFIKQSPRLKAVALLPMQDLDEAVTELRRAVTDYGMVGAMLPALGKHPPFGQRDYYPLYEEAQRLGVMLAVHSATQGIHHLGADDYQRFIEVNTYCFPVGLFKHIVSMMFAGIPDLFPELRIGWMEGGCGWVPYWLERMDEKWELRGAEEAPNLSKSPTESVQNGNWFFHTEAEEKILPYVMSVIGDDKLFYASDFPHWDAHYPASVDQMLERDDLSDEAKRKVMRENAMRLYGLE
jgi:predicted TIM-barrel fold metal-dependent hydrolase